MSKFFTETFIYLHNSVQDQILRNTQKVFKILFHELCTLLQKNIYNALFHCSASNS